MPNSPSVLRPQVKSKLSDLIAAVCPDPALTIVQLNAVVGTKEPSCPKLLSPHTYKNFSIVSTETEPAAANIEPISTPPARKFVVPKAVPPLDTL